MANLNPSVITLLNLNQLIVMILPLFLENNILELKNTEGDSILHELNSAIAAHTKGHNYYAVFPKAAEHCK